MTKQRGRRVVSEPSRREFLRAVGVGPLGLTAFSQAASASVDTTGERDLGDPSYKHLTLDEVERRGYEVHYQEVANAYGGPMSKAPVISVKAHPELVWVRPDMGIGMVANPMAFGMARPAGPAWWWGAEPPALIPWRSVERSLERGYLPIVISRMREGPVIYKQVAYAVLLSGGEVKTGHEKQVVMVRMSLLNTDPSDSQRRVFWAYVPGTIATSEKTPLTHLSFPFGDYSLFEIVGSLPPVPAEALPETDDVLRNGSVIIGVHEEGPGVKVTQYEKILRFELELLPGQEKYAVLKVSTNKKGIAESEVEGLRKLDFSSALDQRVLQLEDKLARGTKIQVPEEAVNHIYKAQILYNQTQMVQVADRDYYMPVQGSDCIVPWEQMKQLVPLDAFGYHEDVKKSLEYFLQQQGKRAPHGKSLSADGVFSQWGIFVGSGWEHDESTLYGLVTQEREQAGIKGSAWMNGTGSALYAMGEHYFYSRDREWLERVAPALIKACNWIIEERQRTKQVDAQGQKVLQYGLLPAGDRDDSGSAGYNLCFNDSYSYQGLKRAAEALADINHPEAQRLLKEAEDYRADILEVMRRTRRPDPDLCPYPQCLNRSDDVGTVFATGCPALVDTGLLDPKDSAFVQLDTYLRKHTNLGVPV